MEPPLPAVVDPHHHCSSTTFKHPMVPSTALLKTPRILPLTQSVDSGLAHSNLLWRRQILLIQSIETAARNTSQPVPALQNPQWFKDCLKQSPIEIVWLDMNLGEAALSQCADACASTGKRVLVHLPTTQSLPKLRSPLAWRIKRMADWLAAAGLVACLSPLLLLIAALVLLTSPGPVLFRQWHIGHRGQLFQTSQFRTMRLNTERPHHQSIAGQTGLHKLKNNPQITSVGRWLQKYSLDELPQLFNVLRGEMSLVGPKPWTLCDAVRVETTLRSRLNALPGVTGVRQVNAHSNEIDIRKMSRKDLDYLSEWSISKDCKLLFLTLLKSLKAILDSGSD